MSDMDSDCDDVFTDDSKGYSCSDDAKGSPLAEEDNNHLVNRKKRRGIIEKRRRDRINNSLSELRRLVPAAFEKQGSAKLEKAEILQMTVDHLRITHTKGLDLLMPFGQHHQGLDYHSIGFRECVSEVARYLVGFEGLDVQDPLRLRLMSHLQCFSAQRDPSSPACSPWFAVPSPLYPSVASPRSSFRTSSNSSAMSLDSGGLMSPMNFPPASPLALRTALRRSSSTLGSDEGGGKGQQRSSAMPHRPWGTEVAY